MLRENCIYKCVINQYCALYLTHSDVTIGKENWQSLEEIRDFLKVFLCCNLFFYEVYYPTST